MGFKKAFDRFFGINEDNETQPEVGHTSTAEEIADLADELVEKSVGEIIEEPVEGLVENVTEEMPGEIIEKIIEDIAEEIPEEIIEEVAEEISGEHVTDTTVPKKSFFAKLKSGLEKTRKSFNDKIDNVLKMFKSVDEEMFEELEEALIMADVGVDTSLYIIGQLKERVSEKKIKEPADVKSEIEDIISEILAQNDTNLHLDTTPSVIMIIGVNGVGKTTSIGKLAAK